MQIKSVCDFRAAMRNGPYAWPGGYPMFFVTSDGEALSFEGARENVRAILDSIANRLSDGWRVIAVEINYEAELYCCHTGKQIEAAYL